MAKSRSETASSEFSHRPSKPSSRATRVAVDREAGAGERRGAQRQPVDPLAAVGQPFAVAREHLDVGEQVVAEGHRLRDLQVREARHDERGVARRPGRAARARSAASSQRMRVDRVAQPQAHVGRDLVVARAAGVQALAGVADQLGQPASMFRCTSSASSDQSNAPAVDLARDPAPCRARSRRGRAGAMMPLRRQHARVRERALDVGLGQPLVEGDRGGEALDQVVMGSAKRPDQVARFLGIRMRLKTPRKYGQYKAKGHPDVLPDFRNLGVIARVLIAVNRGARRRAVRRAGPRAARSSASSTPRRWSSRCCCSIVTVLFVAFARCSAPAVLAPAAWR